jgi:hypothetical protein
MGEQARTICTRLSVESSAFTLTCVDLTVSGLLYYQEAGSFSALALSVHLGHR